MDRFTSDGLYSFREVGLPVAAGLRVAVQGFVELATWPVVSGLDPFGGPQLARNDNVCVIYARE